MERESYKINAHDQLSLTATGTLDFGWTTTGTKLVGGHMLNTRLGSYLAIGTTVSWRLWGTELRSTANVALSGIDGCRMVRHLVLGGRHGGLRTTLSAIV